MLSFFSSFIVFYCFLFPLSRSCRLLLHGPGLIPSWFLFLFLSFHFLFLFYLLPFLLFFRLLRFFSFISLLPFLNLFPFLSSAQPLACLIYSFFCLFPISLPFLPDSVKIQLCPLSFPFSCFYPLLVYLPLLLVRLFLTLFYCFLFHLFKVRKTSGGRAGRFHENEHRATKRQCFLVFKSYQKKRRVSSSLRTLTRDLCQKQCEFAHGLLSSSLLSCLPIFPANDRHRFPIAKVHVVHIAK